MSLRLLRRAAALVLMTVLLAVPASAQAPSLIAIWGGPTDTQARLNDPTAIGMDPATGNVFVGDFSGRVVVLDRTGIFIRQWYMYVVGDRRIGGAAGIVADGLGHVYVLDWNNNCVKKYTVDGTFLAQWGPNFEWGHPGSLNMPDGVALDANGLVYVADCSNSRVEVFGLDGAFLFQWGASGSGAGSFHEPVALTLGPDGTVYISEVYDNHRIQAFRADGTFIVQWGTYGAGAGQFNEAVDLAVAPDGTLYIADEHNNRVQVYGWSATAANRPSWGALKSLYR